MTAKHPPNKVRVLTRMRINEVSLVDRGAGENCRVTISKRDDSDSRLNLIDVFKGKVSAREALGIHVDKSAEGDEAEGLIAEPEHVVDNDGDGDGGVPKKHRSITFDTVDGERMKFPNERSLAEWLAIQSRIRKSTSEDPNPMSFEDKIRDIAKREGVVVIAKIMVADNRSYGISESELVDLISNHERRDGESPAQCFTRQYEAYNDDGAALRKAIAIAKNMPFEDDSEARAEADSRAAMAELTAIGKQRWPSLTKAQQFARAYECNGALAKRATRRPSPSTSFPFPTEKAMSLEPRVTSGGMESFLDVDADAPAAYAELMKLVEQQRREGESEAAAFERVFLDPANKTLALRALGQRVPTESSPPRQS
jgi:hypothetical protein